MIRPITTLKPPQPPRVDPKANAEQITRLQAEATKLRNEIRLANKMGESDAAASARQRLTQVNAELTTAQSAAPATQPAPMLGPMLPTAGSATPQGNGGTTTFPTLFTTQNFGGSSPNLVLAGYTPPDEGNPSPEVTKAEDIVKEIEGGKSIDNIAEERDMKPEEVVAALNAGGMTATATEYANGDTRQVVITDGSGRTITENQDYQHGGYYTEVTGPNGQTTSSPIRDDLGRKETTSVDPKTGAITTTFEDDLGDGSVTERTTNPQTRITTTTETNGEGVVTVTKNLPNGSTVKTVTPNNSVALPVTTVTGPDGKEVTLAQTQTADGSGVPSIQDQLAEGKSFEEIAEERGLKPEQVIAELNAAGLEVEQGGDPGETLQIVVTDPETGKTVTYNNDYHHGSRSVTVTEGNTETTDSVDGNGRTSHTERNTETGEQTTKIVDPKNNTETTIVVDKDGRRTETIVEKLNDGEPIDYEVKPGDNLSDIAEAHGVTLEELAKSNPELFTSPRDPDLIHPGETVVIEGGTKTTVNVTFNGYTLTTHPDGNVTLTNDTTGAVIDIVEGTAQEALAGLLMDINPNSGDPEKAKEDQILKTALDGIFGGATPQLTTEALEKQQAVLDAIEDYGPSKPATPSLEGTPTSVGPFGEPPSATAPSGGKWVPLMVDGNWQWFDPKVAAAIAAENVAVSRLGEAQAKPTQSQAQLDVYALDPEYDQAMEDAEATLDDVLAPYGMDWKPPEPKGTLAEAQQRLNLANTALESATTARTEYEEGQQSLLDAIDKQADLPVISDPSQPAYRSEDGPSAAEENQSDKAAHAEVAELFTNVSLHTANGNKTTVDQLVASTELELKLTDAKPGSAEYKAIEERLEGLQTLQGAAAGQVTLAEAYQEYGVAQSDAADLAVTMEPLKQQLLAQARERNPHHFDWEGYTNGHNEFTGKILSQEVIEENGQLYLVTTYENDVFLDENNNDTNVNKYALTYDLNDEGIRVDFRNDPLNKQWQEMVASTQQTSSSAPVCTANGTGSQSALDAARSKIVGAQVELLDAGLQDAKTALVDATAARDQAITDYGAGTVEPPAGTLKPGEQAVKIEVDGHDVWVAPEVAIAFEKDGPGAIGASGKPVQIEIDGQKLWVHPEIAAAEIQRSQAESEKERLENWEKDVRPAMVAGRDWYAFSASHPKLLELGAAQHESELKSEYFDENREQAMAGYQVQLKNLYDAGFTGEYKEYTSGELSSTVAETLGLDPSSEGVEKVVDEITDRAGDNPEVKLVPIFALDGGMESSTALFEIKTGEGETGYVDTSGKYYDSFDEFQHENRIFSEEGNLVMAKGGDMSLGKDGFTLDELQVADARKVDFWDRATDIGLGIVAGVSTIVSFVPGGQWAIPIAITSGAALGGKALVREGEHLLQGGEFDSQSAWNITMGVTSFLPVGAGALRTFGLARAGLPASKSLAGGFGMGQMQNASWGVGKFRVNVQQSSYADDVKAFMQSGSKLNTAAWGLDAGAVVTGVPLLGKSMEDLAAHGGDMSLLELANAVMGIGTGLVGTGLGGRGLLNNMPGGGPRSGSHPSGSFRGGPESGPQPRAVYEMGPDGVYRPTGEYVMPDPNEVVIDGDVVGETSGQQGTGPRALPAGDTGGPNQPPPTGGRFDPSGGGQSSRPMVVHEQGADGVHRPTDEVVFHDSNHPVVEGTVVNVHDDGEVAPGERGDAESARDGSADGARESNARQPADSEPIVVPTAARDTGATSGKDNGGFGRLTWDPVTKSFTGMPEANTADYIYTSGKDPQTPSVYLDGVRPGDPMVKFTPEELLARYEQESRYHSGREMAERHGPNGVLTSLATQAADGGGPLLSPKPAPRGNGSPNKAGENAYVPPTDFDAAMNALGAGPQRPAIEAAPPTTHTLDQVRNMRQPHKWRAGEEYTRELNGSLGEKHFPVDADPNGKYPIVGDGGRYVDAPVYNARGDVEAIEVKTYHRWRTVKGVAEMREVPLSKHLRQQINKDIALRDKDPAYQPRWVFLDAPPSPELQNALNDARIIGNIMGHNKPSKTRVAAASNQNTSGGTKLTDAELAANREEALQLFDSVIRQDLRISDMTILDLADQFSRSPTLMSLLRAAHQKQVRIVNSARSDLHIQDVNLPDHDVNARGIFYDPTLKVISLDGDQLAQEATNLTPDVVVGEQAGRLAHELSHVGDPDYLNPADFADEATFVDAFVNASLQDEGRARFTEFKVAEELAENGGAPSNILTFADPAEVAVFENYRSGAIDETTAVNQLGDLFGQMEPSYGSDTNYHALYTENAKSSWADRPGEDGNDTLTGSTGQGGVKPGPAANQSGGSRPAAGQPLTRDAVRAVPLDQVQNLNMADFQPNQVGWMTREQVAKLTEQQFADMDRLGLLPHLTKSQLRGIPKNRIGDVNVGGLAERQIPWLTNGQVGKLSEQQFRALGEAGLHRHLTKSQLQGIPGSKIGFLDVSTLDATQIPWLKPKQTANFTQKQLGDISESGVLALLSKEQLRAIPETDIVAIDTAKLDARQVPWLTDGQVAQLTETQLQALGEAGLLKHLTESQLGAVPDTKIGAVDVTKLDASQVPWLTDAQIANLTEQQFKDLGESGLLKNFTESQVKAIPAERLDIAKLDPTQVPWLTDAQIAALTRDQWGAFTVNHIEALTRPQIEAMTPKQFEELSPGQFRKFTLEQFEWMSTDQANALSVLQLTTFKTAYRKTMTPSQRILVEGALVYSRTREHQMALDTFGTMAGTSYMLWSSLPPHWTATAGGVMFALRGVVFSAQSVFPNATAPHTRLGRALNLASGLSFIASSPGSAAPLFQSGTNPLVNGTFTLGNMIYGTKSTLQAFTGRTAMRLLGDHVGNFAYLSGSIAYTVQNLHSPLGWISGGLFTLGSAEFWGSAIRTEVLNRKAPPRTDAEIAAAAKSDKRWAAWDRIALGVTFGIGMFLFAWDTLDGEPWKVAAPGGQDPTKPDEPTGTDQPDEPDDPPPVESEPEPEPEEYPQLVVTADDGLNLRATPGTDSEKVTVLEPGTFVEQTGKPSNESGETWIPVEGFGPDGKTYTGWVSSEHVATHPEGASNPEGRTNPKLEESGYEWVEVQDGDSIRLIASNRSADVEETVVLNMDHILSPDVIFAGDRIYLPVTATG